MHATALYIAKGSRRPGRCGRCGHAVTWATLARRGAKNIPLIASPVVLRDEQADTGVTVEVLAFDQVHRCTVRKPPAPRRSATTVPARLQRRSDTAYASFTPDRIQQLKEQIAAPKSKPPQPSRL
jgi:hypothetical protein